MPYGFLPAAAAPPLLPVPEPPPSPESAAHDRVFRKNNYPILLFSGFETGLTFFHISQIWAADGTVPAGLVNDLQPRTGGVRDWIIGF